MHGLVKQKPAHKWNIIIVPSQIKFGYVPIACLLICKNTSIFSCLLVYINWLPYGVLKHSVED